MKILMIVQEPVVTRRILQEAHSLIDAGYRVSLLTRAESTEDYAGEIEGIPTQWVAVRGRDRRFKWLYKLIGVERGSNVAALWGVLTGRHTFTTRALPFAVRAHADVYHAHDLNNLELAYLAARYRGARLVYDSHEIFSEIANRWIRMRRNAWQGIEKQLILKAGLVITVNEFIAVELVKRYGISQPLVVMNCPDPPPDFSPDIHYDLLRRQLNLAAGQKIVLYQGWMWEGRGLESLVRSAPLLVDDARVVLMGYGEYQEVLEKMAAREAAGRVHFVPAVPQRQLLAYCVSADVGVIPYQAVDLNNYYSSPNKLFDYIQARLPIVASDLPFLHKVIVNDSLGAVGDLSTPESCARALNHVLSLPDGGSAIRDNMRRVAPQYTWETQARKLVSAYQAMLQKPISTK